MPILRILPLGLFALMLAFAVGTYADLPAQIPTHFDLSGTVTAVRTKSIQNWFGLPFIALGVHLLLLTLTQMLPQKPHLFNFPDKERFLRLPTAYQSPVIAAMQWMLDLTSLGVMLVMATVQVLMWRAAMGKTDEIAHLALLIGCILLGPAILISITRVTNAVDAAEKRWREDERTGRVR